MKFVHGFENMETAAIAVRVQVEGPGDFLPFRLLTLAFRLRLCRL